MKNRNDKKYSILVLLLIVGISIGYALLSTTLRITGKSSIGKSSWDVHFENIQIKEGSVAATKEPTITNNTTIANFELKLSKPGEYYEFTVDVVNDGTIDAMIDSIIKRPELTESQKKYLNYIIEYQNGEQLAKKQLVEKESYVTLKVRVEYKRDIDVSDLPVSAEALSLGLTVDYVQADETGTIVKNHGVIGANGDINEVGTIVTIGTEKFYTMGTEGDNVKLLSMYNLYIGSEVKYIDFNTGVFDISAISNSTGMQSERAKGRTFISVSNLRLPWVGITPFSNSDKHGTNYTDYEGSIVEGYVDTYHTLLEEKFDVDVLEARIISYDELTGAIFECDVNSCENSPYSWIHSTSYWTSTMDHSSAMKGVYAGGYIDNPSYTDNLFCGVRPVIVISKDYF